MRQDVHSPSFTRRAPKPSPRYCGRFSRSTRKHEEVDARRQDCNGALSFDREGNRALDHTVVAPEDDR
jgi:hypothetical protein